MLDEFTRKFERVRDKVENFMIPLKWSAYGSYGFTMLVPNLEEVQRWYQILINTIHEFHENLGRVSAYINVQAIVNRVRLLLYARTILERNIGFRPFFPYRCALVTWHC